MHYMRMKNKNSFNYAIKTLFVLSALVVMTNCGGKNSGTSLAISLDDFITKYESASGKIQLLDVRTPDEYNSGHVPGAVLLPVSDLTSGAAVSFEKNSEVYVICRSGKRSMAAAEYLQSQGFTSVKSVSGGTMAWAGRDKPLDK